MSQPSIFDVIENYWGNRPVRRIQRADKPALKDFGDEVNRFYDAYEPLANEKGCLRSYFGGLVAANFGAPEKQQTFFNNLLYSHSVVVPDPIARWYFDRYEELPKTPPIQYPGLATIDQSEWIGWILSSYRAFQWDLYACRNILAFFVASIAALKPLASAGIVVMVSQAHALIAEPSAQLVEDSLGDARDEEFQRLCQRADEYPPLWDNVRGAVMTPNVSGSAPPTAIVQEAIAKEAAYQIRKNLRIAAAAGGVYIPENETDCGLLARILARIGANLPTTNLEFQTARAVQSLTLPSIEGLRPADFVAIRTNEEAFENFRRTLGRKLIGASGEGGEAIVNLTGEEIEAEIADLRQTLSASNSIKNRLRQDGLRIAVQSLISGAVKSSAELAILSAAAGALVSAYVGLRDRDRQSQTVLAKIARMNRVSPDAILGKEGLVSRAGLPRALAVLPLGQVFTGPGSPPKSSYDPSSLRRIVEGALKANMTGNPFKAIRA